MAREDRAALLGNDATEAARQLLAIGLAVSADGRLDLLPPVRDAARRLAPATEAETDRWCRHYLGLFTELGPSIGATGGAEAVARLAPEVANLDAAFAASLAERRPIAVAAADGLRDLLRITGLGRPAVLHDLAVSCHAASDLAGEARCRFAAGMVAFYRSDHEAARAAYEQALPLYRQVGDVLGEANCIQSLGDIALRRSDHDAARAAYEQALPLYRQVGAVLGEANCIKSLGDIALARSDHDAARAAYEQALPLYRQVGDVLGEANCIQSLGDIALRHSDHDAARAAWQQALTLYTRIPEPYSIGWTHHRLARIATGAQQAAHIAAARQAWTSIDRPDLLPHLDALD
jgi:tetratricopeptide (TPR) repeat protein